MFDEILKCFDILGGWLLVVWLLGSVIIWKNIDCVFGW